MTACVGTALLAKTNLLNGVKATSNKRAFESVKSINLEVK
jgi:putative intracellular protease/amidase